MRGFVGWSGSPPRKDHELIKRLIDADKAVRGHESLNLKIEKRTG